MEKPNDDKVLISPNDYVKVTKMNHIIEVQHMEKTNHSIHIKKIDKNTYVDLKTGEIKEFSHSENRQENYNSLRQTFKKLRYLINSNLIGSPNELHVTLTYRKNMKDTKQLYSDFDKFFKRLKYKFKNDSSIDYISVVEPQERGAWHCHVLLRFNDLDTIFIKNSDMRDLWGHGFVTVKTLKDIDNIGAYLSAYLADVELTGGTVAKAVEESREIIEKEVDGQKKRFVKGGRLHMYPSGMNLYRKSKGMAFPDREDMKFKDIKKVVGSSQPHYQKSYHIQNEDFENTISFLQYNMKRNNTE